MSEPASIHSSPAAPPRKLSAELHALNERFGQESVQLGDIIDVLGSRAYSLMLVLLALPFFTPISLLGVSTAIGAVIAYLGLRLALGLRPHLPEALRRRRLPPRFFGLLLRGTERIIRLLERVTRKRLSYFLDGPWPRLLGAGIVASALLLMLPLPIPFSNVLPAAAIVGLATGRLEEDGGMILAGFAMLLLSLVFFGLLSFFGVEAFEFLQHWYAAHFGAGAPLPMPSATP